MLSNQRTSDPDEIRNALQDWAVFQDTIRFYDNFSEFVDHSALVARSFPVKRLKVTAALGPVIKGYGFSSSVAEVMPPEYPIFTYEVWNKLPFLSV